MDTSSDIFDPSWFYLVGIDDLDLAADLIKIGRLIEKLALVPNLESLIQGIDRTIRMEVLTGTDQARLEVVRAWARAIQSFRVEIASELQIKITRRLEIENKPPESAQEESSPDDQTPESGKIVSALTWQQIQDAPPEKSIRLIDDILKGNKLLAGLTRKGLCRELASGT